MFGLGGGAPRRVNTAHSGHYPWCGVARPLSDGSLTKNAHPSRHARESPRRDKVVPLSEGACAAGPLSAPPDPSRPHQADRDPEARRVRDPSAPTAMTNREHPTRRAPAHRGVGLAPQQQPILAPLHVEHVHPRNVEHRISPSAPTHARTTPTVIHVGVFISSGSLVAPDPEGPDTPIPAPPRRSQRRPTHA